jgi:hypothetical protein
MCAILPDAGQKPNRKTRYEKASTPTGTISWTHQNTISARDAQKPVKSRPYIPGGGRKGGSMKSLFGPLLLAVSLLYGCGGGGSSNREQHLVKALENVTAAQDTLAKTQSVTTVVCIATLRSNCMPCR